MAKIATWRDQYQPNPDIVYYMYEALLGSKLKRNYILFPFGPTAELCSTIYMYLQLKNIINYFWLFFNCVIYSSKFILAPLNYVQNAAYKSNYLWRVPVDW